MIKTSIFCIAASIVRSQLLKDGNFDNAVNCNDRLCVNPASQFFPNSWQSIPNTIELDSSSGNVPIQGKYSVDLNTDRPYTLFQTVQGLAVGQSYVLSFKYGRNGNCDKDSKDFFVRVGGNGGVNLPSQRFSTPASQSGFQLGSFTFAAFSTSHTVYFGSLSGGACGPVIDSITLDPSNQPSPAVRPNLLLNGDFESALYACDNPEYCYVNPSQTIKPWQSTAGDSGTVEVNLNSPFSGRFSVDLNTDTPTQIYQDVKAVPGHTLQLSFNMRANRNCDDRDKVGYVQVLGSDGKTYVFQSFVAGQDWKVASFEFVAGCSNLRIGLGSSENGNCGAMVDYVTLVDMNTPPVTGQRASVINAGQYAPYDPKSRFLKRRKL